MAGSSNKTLISIILLSLAAVLLGEWVLYDKLQPTGLAANPTGTVSANVQSTVDIFLKNNTVNFGSVGVSSTFDTSVNYTNASQFLLRNDGSVTVNVTLTGTSLWNSTCVPTQYRFNVTNATGNNSIVTDCANYHKNTWYSMPLSDATICSPQSVGGAICNFNFTDNHDYSRIDIQITVPSGEGAGAHTSTVTFTASQA